MLFYFSVFDHCTFFHRIPWLHCIFLKHKEHCLCYTGNGEFPIGNRKNATEEKQIPGIRGLNVSTQRCWRCWQNQPYLAKTRGDPLITTWRLHGLLHQCECFRHSPWVLIRNKAMHPRFPRF
jgi:hypothetical protein